MLSSVGWGFSLYNYPIVSTLVSEQLNLSNTQSGLVTASFVITYAAMQIPAGYLAYRFGSARCLLISLVVMGFSPLLLVANNSYFFALSSRLIGGVAGGVVWLCAVRILSDWFPATEIDKATRVFGVASGGAVVFSSVVFPLLIFGRNWTPPLVVTSAFCLATAGVVAFPAMWSRTEERAPRNLKVDVRGLFTRNMFALTMPNFVGRLVLVGVYSWAFAFLSTLLLPGAAAGDILALIGVGTILGSYVGGIRTKRVGRRAMMKISMILTIITTFSLGFANSVDLAAFLILAIGFSGMLYFSANFALIPYAARQGVPVAGLTFGIFNTISNIGSFISPVMIGYILDSTRSYVIGFGALGALASVGLIGIMFLKSETPRNGVL